MIKIFDFISYLLNERVKLWPDLKHVMTSTTSDLALLGRKLGAVDYKPDIYVKEIAQRCVGGHELLLQRNNIKVSTFILPKLN